MIKFATLQYLSIAQIRDCLNSAFSDYAIPFRYSVKQLETKFHVESIDTSVSVGAFDGDDLVGLILHGRRPSIDGLVIYNGGTGVVPNYRGHGLTTKMYAYILPVLMDQGASLVRLEVLSGNIPAIKSYKSVGFCIQRYLTCYQGTMTLPTSTSIDYQVEVTDWSNIDHLTLQAEVSPSWQNNNESLRRSSTSTIVGISTADQLCGYCIVNPDRRRLQQIYISANHRRRRMATTLLQWVHDHVTPIEDISNIDRRAIDLQGFLSNTEMQQRFEQYEMELDLKTSSTSHQ